MREIRTYGSEGGAAQANASSLPLCAPVSACHQSGESPLHVHASSVKSNVTASPRGGVESNGRRTIGP